MSDDFRSLSADFTKAAARMTPALFDVVRETAEDLRDRWRDNARVTAGEHGRRYPDSITADMRLGFGIEAEVGPDPRLPQGGMSFEYGSVNQPPHLDGQNSADAIEPLFEQRVDAALALLGL